jgi:protein gp37
MNERQKYAGWNPWHGCTKVSPGCKYCYVYRQDAMYGSEKSSSEVTKNLDFDLPIKRKRDNSYKIPSGTIVFTCFTSDFLVADADAWRPAAWQMMRERKDLMFYFFTKRIDRLSESLPEDWGDGYENVLIGCTVENQAMADYRLPIFNSLPIKHKSIIVGPILEAVDLDPYLNKSIEEVAVSGESGMDARVCDYDWVLNIREQCIRHDIPFCFHQTGAKLMKNGKVYNIMRRFQISQARKAGIDYRIGPDQEPIL